MDKIAYNTLPEDRIFSARARSHTEIIFTNTTLDCLLQAIYQNVGSISSGDKFVLRGYITVEVFTEDGRKDTIKRLTKSREILEEAVAWNDEYKTINNLCGGNPNWVDRAKNYLGNVDETAKTAS